MEIVIDRVALRGRVELVGTSEGALTEEEAGALLAARPTHPGVRPHPKLPDDTRLWAALQRVSGGTWAGCVYDVDRIVEAIEAGLAARSRAGADERLTV